MAAEPARAAGHPSSRASNHTWCRSCRSPQAAVNADSMFGEELAQLANLDGGEDEAGVAEVGP